MHAGRLGRLLLLAPLALVAAACAGNPTRSSATDQLGRRVASNVWAFAWSARDAIAFVQTRSGVRALLTADSSAFEPAVVDSGPVAAIVASSTGASGTHFYWFTQRGTGGSWVLVTPGPGWPFVAGGAVPVTGTPLGLAASGNGRHVAYATDSPQAIQVRGLQQALATSLPAGVPIAFRPGDEELLFVAPQADGCGVYGGTLSSGAVRPLDLHPGGECPLLLRWQADSVEAVWGSAPPPLSRGATLTVLRRGSLPRVFYTVPRDAYLESDRAAWSPDGLLVALWYNECSGSEPIPHDPYTPCRRTLYVVDVESGAERWVAGGGGVPGQTAISPDNRWIAYVLDHQLFVNRLP